MKKRAQKPAKLTQYLSDPFLKPYYNEQKRKLEVAEELYGMTEDDYLSMWIRVIVDKTATEEDEDHFDMIINQVYREFGISR